MGLAFAPLWVVFGDSSAAVRKKAKADEPRDQPAKTVGLFIFPILLATVGAFTDLPSLIVAATGPITWLALAKRFSAKSLIDFSTVQVIASIAKLSKRTLIGTGTALAATLIVAFVDHDALAGIPFLLAGYPAAVKLGRVRIKEIDELNANDAADRRLVMIALGGLSDAQAEYLSIYRAGSQSEGTLQIHSGQLPPTMISITASSVERILSVHAPKWEAVSFSVTDGLVLGAVSEAVLRRRVQLAESEGFAEDVQDVEAASGGEWDIFG